MKDEKKTEIKVGITVLLGILIFIWILGWAKNISLQSNEQPIDVRFDNVAGLEIGDPVTVNGVKKGYVESMKVEPNYVIVKMMINDDIKLKQDATFAISMLDLMGGKKVEVFPGESVVPFDKNKLAVGKFYADIPSVMSLFGSVQDDLVTILKDVKISLHSMNKYLTDEKLSNNVQSSMANLNELTNKLNIILSENRNDIKTLTTNTVELTQKSNEMLTENKENIKEIISNLKIVFLKSDSLLTDLNSLTKETMNQQNNIGKFLYDENIIKDLKQSLKQVNELTSILIEQLKNKGVNVDANIF